MTFTKEQLIEKLKHRISVASGFPESEKAQIDLELARIALASLELEAAQVVPEEMTPKKASRSYCGEVRGYRDGWNACRAKVIGNMFLADMDSAVTDNTNQQFESLSRGDK